MVAPLKVTIDGRVPDSQGPGVQGLRRYDQGLLGALPRVARERQGELAVLRRRGGLMARPGLRASSRTAVLAEQALLPLELARVRSRVHHALSIYRTPFLSPARVVVTVHDLLPLQWPELYLRTGTLHRLVYGAVRRAAAIVCPSSAVRADVERHLGVEPERVFHVPEAAAEQFRPVDASDVPSRLGLTSPYVLYVGDLEEPRKHVAGLIEAFSRWAQSEDRPERLVLAGPGSVSGGRERVVHAGFVPDSELPALYSGASCVVSASRYEGFGLPALEAIACGTPVVAYETGAIPETAGPGGLLVPPGDATALMVAAGRVCDDPALAERLSAEGRRHAARFSWRRTAELTWDVYEQVA